MGCVFSVESSSTFPLSDRSVYGNPIQGSASYECAVWTGTRLVAVMPRDTVLTSADGIQWSKRSTGSDAYLNAIVWTGTRLVATGVNHFVVSTDGVNWSEPVLFKWSNLYSLAWTGSSLVATGELGRISTSRNGIDWEWHATGTSGKLKAVAWTGKQLVAVGNGGNGQGTHLAGWGGMDRPCLGKHLTGGDSEGRPIGGGGERNGRVTPFKSGQGQFRGRVRAKCPTFPKNSSPSCPDLIAIPEPTSSRIGAAWKA